MFYANLNSRKVEHPQRTSKLSRNIVVWGVLEIRSKRTRERTTVVWTPRAWRAVRDRSRQFIFLPPNSAREAWILHFQLRKLPKVKVLIESRGGSGSQNCPAPKLGLFSMFPLTWAQTQRRRRAGTPTGPAPQKPRVPWEPGEIHPQQERKLWSHKSSLRSRIRSQSSVKS